MASCGAYSAWNEVTVPRARTGRTTRVSARSGDPRSSGLLARRWPAKLIKRREYRRAILACSSFPLCGWSTRAHIRSAFSSQYVIPIAWYIVVAVARCCACSRLPVRW